MNPSPFANSESEPASASAIEPAEARRERVEGAPPELAAEAEARALEDAAAAAEEAARVARGARRLHLHDVERAALRERAGEQAARQPQRERRALLAPLRLPSTAEAGSPVTR